MSLPFVFFFFALAQFNLSDFFSLHPLSIPPKCIASPWSPLLRSLPGGGDDCKAASKQARQAKQMSVAKNVSELTKPWPHSKASLSLDTFSALCAGQSKTFQEINLKIVNSLRNLMIIIIVWHRFRRAQSSSSASGEQLWPSDLNLTHFWRTSS